MFPDHLASRVRLERETAARALLGTLIDDLVGRRAESAKTALVARRFAPPGLDASRFALRSVEGGFDEVRDVFAGRWSRSTSSTSSFLLNR